MPERSLRQSAACWPKRGLWQQMRLTCPNCKAQYEVEETVVPPEGRDVQCSSCGTTWFQYPASVALQMRASDLDDDDDDDDPAPSPQSASRAESAAPRVDRTVLDVLRSEAERELSERKRARPGVESQGDLGLVSRPQRRGKTDARTPQPDVGPPPNSRGELLPDIEELSSTLAPRQREASREEPQGGNEPAEDRQSRSGFMAGLLTVLTIILVLAALYILAPILSDRVPALETALQGYVALVDNLRDMITGLLGG